MPKVTVRKDGTWFTQAVVTPGSGLVRTWEVKQEGVEWLRRQGIRVGEEMGRSRFHQLLERRFAYIANSTASEVKVSKASTKALSERQPRSGTTNMAPTPGGSSKHLATAHEQGASHGLRSQAPVQRQPVAGTSGVDAMPPPPQSVVTPPKVPKPATLPAHLSRKTKKKDWFT